MSILRSGSRGREVTKLQSLLNTKLSPSPNLDADGIFGRGTQDAVRQFQRQQGLDADGIVGPKTWAALESAPPSGATRSSSPTPTAASSRSTTTRPSHTATRASTASRPRRRLTDASDWMKVAEGEIGQKEDKRRGQHNDRIVAYHQATSGRVSDDETPWCSAFVNWVMAEAGYAGTNDGRANSWLTWGKRLDAPREGAITVIRRKQAGRDRATGSRSGYHVGFYHSTQHGLIRILGGNQSDQVRYSNFPLKDYEVSAYRWPS